MSVPIITERKVERLRAIAEGRAAIRSGRLRELRERLGLSQRELARALDVDESAVSRWEAGERVPREAAAERLAALLRVLEVDPSESATPALAGVEASRRQPADEEDYQPPQRAA
jgi:transcriptional regulator with XRE-family HTH domain